MREIAVASVSLDRLGTLLPPERVERLTASAARARSELGDRIVWHVNATAVGGGVVELLHTLLAYGNGAGVENRWLVLDADGDYFTITKRVQNLLHGQQGDGGPLAGAERSLYLAVLADNAATLKARVSRRDIVVLHDPQTAPYAPEWLDQERLRVIAPSIDPFSAKNADLSPAVARSVLVRERASCLVPVRSAGQPLGQAEGHGRCHGGFRAAW